VEVKFDSLQDHLSDLINQFGIESVVVMLALACAERYKAVDDQATKQSVEHQETVDVDVLYYDQAIHKNASNYLWQAWRRIMRDITKAGNARRLGLWFLQRPIMKPAHDDSPYTLA